MGDKLQQAISQAVGAIENAYAPYSKHPVGSAIIADDGNIYAGCNVENAAYPLGQCAESNAIGNMILNGGRSIVHIVIVGPGVEACTPCGGCRQKIREFAGKKGAPVTVCDRNGAVLLETDSATLLPHAFGPENIEN